MCVSDDLKCKKLNCTKYARKVPLTDWTRRCYDETNSMQHFNKRSTWKDLFLAFSIVNINSCISFVVGPSFGYISKSGKKLKTIFATFEWVDSEKIIRRRATEALPGNKDTLHTGSINDAWMHTCDKTNPSAQNRKGMRGKNVNNLITALEKLIKLSREARVGCQLFFTFRNNS